jgi:hypothetical protein
MLSEDAGHAVRVTAVVEPDARSCGMIACP